jgi:hypothetical protein
MNKLIVVIFALFSIGFFGYLVLPNPDFPKPPPDSFQSKEPADIETPLRRSYFTNFTREEVVTWYKNQFGGYRLNYPPEEAQTIIRDQTRSTFLEEIVHPFRESIYINGFEPKNPKDVIFIEGRNWRQKITVRYVPSTLIVRVLIFAGMVILSILLFKGWAKTWKNFYN